MEHETTKQVTSCLPMPLTRRNKDGDVYQRLATVDRQIQDTLKLDPEELRKCLEVRDEASSYFLKEETLVYLIRHSRKVGDRQRANDLSTCLVNRCAKLIHGRLGILGADVRDDGYSEVVEELFARILDLESNRGDFLQVRFWVVLERLTIQAFRKLVKQSKSESSSAYDGEDTDSLVRMGRVVGAATISHRSTESEVIENSLIREALSQLEEPFRSAYILRHYSEWPIEDQDPTVQTISRHFGKTSRTIRNWLARAEKSLATWRGERL